MTWVRVSGGGNLIEVVSVLSPVKQDVESPRRSESRTGVTLRRAGSNTEIRTGPAGDGGFTVNTVLEDPGDFA
jgi:hypothetical protein